MTTKRTLPHRHRQSVSGRRHHLAHPGTLPQPKLHAGSPIRIIRTVPQRQIWELETGKISVSRFPLPVFQGGAHAN